MMTSKVTYVCVCGFTIVVYSLTFVNNTAFIVVQLILGARPLKNTTNYDLELNFHESYLVVL